MIQDGEELKRKFNESVEFAEKHIYECAAEMTEWYETAILRDGKVRELAELCLEYSPNGLAQAEALITKVAFKSLVKHIDWHRAE